MNKGDSIHKARKPTVADSGFSVNDYVKMFKYDFRAPFIYFFERHLFDLMNKTDTHKRLLVEDYSEDIQDLAHSFNHSCSWTSIVKSTLAFVYDYIGSEASAYSFFDIGCGKGKVLLVASKEGYSEKFLDLYGVEINPVLVEVAHSNFQLMGLPRTKIITESAATLDLGRINKRVVIYLYNPFDEILLEQFLEAQSLDECIIIYNNPQFPELILRAGYKVIKNQAHDMTNGQVTIYKNS